MNDDDIRALIASASQVHAGPGGNPDAYRLTLIAEELMAQRDRRSEDFYRSNRAIHELEERLAKVRAEVAEGFADALEDEAGRLRGSPFRSGEVGFEHIQGIEAAAHFIRDHGKED